MKIYGRYDDPIQTAVADDEKYSYLAQRFLSYNLSLYHKFNHFIKFDTARLPHRSRR